MTNHLAAIREAAEKIYKVGVDREGLLTYTAREMQAIMAGNSIAIIHALDAAEKDSKTTLTVVMRINTRSLYSNAPVETWAEVVCAKCGHTIYRVTHCCPGCGRRIVKEDAG